MPLYMKFRDSYLNYYREGQITT